MANYLERVAASAATRAAIARPPNSGPPVLPAGRDFAPAMDDPFASDQDQFLDPVEIHAPAHAEERAEIASPKPEVAKESTTTPTQDPISATSAAPKPRPLQERLSSESPFTVHVPRTLRPGSTANVPPTVANEPPREQPRVRASTTKEEPTPIVRSTDADVREVKQSVISETGPTTPTIAGPIEEHQAPARRPVQTEIAGTTPIPRVDRVDGPARLPVAEPAPPPAMPVQLPVVASSNTTRQEQSRITIGSLEVLVNNHPRVAPARPAPTPSRSESLNLEKRYLDRFRLRH